jgi:hypothetical protein
MKRQGTQHVTRLGLHSGAGPFADKAALKLGQSANIA